MSEQEKEYNMQKNLLRDAVEQVLPSDDKLCMMIFNLNKVRDYATEHCNQKEGLDNEVFETDEIVRDYTKLLHELWMFRKEAETLL